MAMTLGETAELLRVSPERVRQLINKGSLPARRFGRMWVIDEQDAERMAVLLRPSGRPLSPAVAWQEIEVLERGGVAPTADEVGALAARLRGRSVNRRVRVHPAALHRMGDDPRLVTGGATAAAALGAPIAGDGPSDAYVRAGDLATVVDDYRPVERPANLFLRAVPDDVWPFADGLRLVGPVTAILDLVDAGDRTATEALSIWPEP